MGLQKYPLNAQSRRQSTVSREHGKRVKSAVRAVMEMCNTINYLLRTIRHKYIDESILFSLSIFIMVHVITIYSDISSVSLDDKDKF